MKVSQRELTLLIITVFSLLFGGAIVMVKPKIEHIQAVRAEQEQIRWQNDRDRQFVARRDVLAGKYDELSKLLPPASKEDMGVHWQQILDRIAGKNEFKLINSKASLEKQIGDVYEILIDCKDWNGNLDSLVHFLFDLQSEGAMLDVRRLVVRTTGRESLRGSFALYCAYTRSDVGKTTDNREDTK